LIPSLNTGILFLCGILFWNSVYLFLLIFIAQMNLQGPVVAALNNQFGTRPVVMIGSIVYTLCYVLSAFATSIYQIVFLLGFIGGFGFLNFYLFIFVFVDLSKYC
jgi:hypothetical protein